MKDDPLGRHPTDEGTVHWIETGPGTTGDFVTDEELEAASDWLKDYKEKQHVQRPHQEAQENRP